jgi:hypothetical protein
MGSPPVHRPQGVVLLPVLPAGGGAHVGHPSRGLVPGAGESQYPAEPPRESDEAGEAAPTS